MGGLTAVTRLPRRILQRTASAATERALRRQTLHSVSPVFTELPGTPFDVVVSNDGAHAFVSLPSRDGSAVAALAAGADGGWTLVRTLRLPGGALPRGLALDNGGQYLLAASAAELVVLDVQALLAGAERVVATTVETSGGSVHLCTSSDDRVAYVTDEDAAALDVVDFGDPARLVASVPLPPAPVGCALSADGRHVFVTSQLGGKDGAGVLSVVDVASATAVPERAVVARVEAGSRPVRVAVAASGRAVWVTARGSNRLLAFDADTLAPLAEVPVGPAPVGLTFARNGGLLAVANSNRFRGGNRPQTLSVIDVEDALAGRRAVLGTVPAGVFPRELATLPDDQTIVATNFTSRTLETASLAGVTSR